MTRGLWRTPTKHHRCVAQILRSICFGKATRKISRAIGIMYKLQPFLPLKVMKNVYYSLIYSHIIYAIEAWGSACKTELDKIFILQKRAMRLMTYNDKYPTMVL